MAIKLFELGFVLKARDYLSPVLKNVQRNIEGINQASKNLAPLREAGANLAMAGGVMVAAGAAIGAGVYSVVKPAIDFQATMAHVKTAVDDGAQTMAHLNEVQRVTAALSAKGVINQEALGNAYYISRSNMLGHAESLQAIAVASKLVTGTTENAAAAQEQMMPTTRTLTTLVRNFHGSLAAYGDQLAKLQTKYSFLNIGEITGALKYAMPITMASGVAVSQMNTALALISESGFHDAEAGMRYQELLSKLTTDRRLNAFVVRTAQGGLNLQATLEKLGATFAAMPAVLRMQQLKTLGFNERDLQGLSDLMPRLSEFAAVNKDLMNASGANAAAFATRMNAVDEQFAKFSNNIRLLREALGVTLLPAIGRAIAGLTGVVQTITKFAEAHKTLIKFGLAFAAITAAILVVSGTILTAVGAVMAFAAVVGVAATSVGAFLAGVAGIAIAGGLALAGIVMAWTQIKNFFTHMIPDFFSAGVKAVLAFAEGIAHGAVAAGAAVERVAAKVRAYLPFSPAKEGPLRDLNRIRIAETIANAIRPAPIMNAMRGATMAMAMAVPMASGGIGGGAGAIHYSPTIHITIAPGSANPQDIKQAILQALESDKDRFMSVIQSARSHRARREF